MLERVNTSTWIPGTRRAGKASSGRHQQGIRPTLTEQGCDVQAVLDENAAAITLMRAGKENA